MKEGNEVLLTFLSDWVIGVALPMDVAWEMVVAGVSSFDVGKGPGKEGRSDVGTERVMAKVAVREASVISDRVSVDGDSVGDVCIDVEVEIALSAARILDSNVEISAVSVLVAAVVEDAASGTLVLKNLD